MTEQIECDAIVQPGSVIYQGRVDAEEINIVEYTLPDGTSGVWVKDHSSTISQITIICTKCSRFDVLERIAHPLEHMEDYSQNPAVQLIKNAKCPRFGYDIFEEDDSII